MIRPKQAKILLRKVAKFYRRLYLVTFPVVSTEFSSKKLKKPWKGLLILLSIPLHEGSASHNLCNFKKPDHDIIEFVLIGKEKALNL